MTISYLDLGSAKRISEIVFSGSHDASITSGSSYAQTQDRNIKEQAEAGVRIFDLRILARKFDDGQAKLVGYHGSGGGKGSSQFQNHVTGKVHQVETNTRIAGEFGLTLTKMLEHARDFVKLTNEFLIFKFDKSTNYDLIAQYCVKILGDAIYKPIGKEFGKLTLGDLKGKVVCVFNDGALKEIPSYKAADGILGFKSLRGEKNSVGQYDSKYPGLQYYGKGGTDAWRIYKSNKGKMSENISKQRKMLMAMAAQEGDFAADVLGMMYWTSTGATSSIRDRNENTMWGTTGVQRMGELWREGLEKSIATQLTREHIKVLEWGGRMHIKAYFPNIIMIDFADPGKCQTIYDLNKVVDERLAKAYQTYIAG